LFLSLFFSPTQANLRSLSLSLCHTHTPLCATLSSSFSIHFREFLFSLAQQTQHSKQKTRSHTHRRTGGNFIFIFRLLLASFTIKCGKSCGNLIIKKHSPWFRFSRSVRAVSLTHTQHAILCLFFSRARRKVPSAKYFPTRFFSSKFWTATVGVTKSVSINNTVRRIYTKSKPN